MPNKDNIKNFSEYQFTEQRLKMLFRNKRHRVRNGWKKIGSKLYMELIVSKLNNSDRAFPAS